MKVIFKSVPHMISRKCEDTLIDSPGFHWHAWPSNAEYRQSGEDFNKTSPMG